MRLRRFSIVFLLFLLGDVFALQGGPVQPDYLQFEPADMPDLVNLYTGDFAYSIPLGEVPGPYGTFPISMSYHAGISPQQEASWVGLGWTLNPGAINRTVRGVPDDQFHGGTLGFIYKYSAYSNWAISVSGGDGRSSIGITVQKSGTVGLNATYCFLDFLVSRLNLTGGTNKLGYDETGNKWDFYLMGFKGSLATKDYGRDIDWHFKGSARRIASNFVLGQPIDASKDGIETHWMGSSNLKLTSNEKRISGSYSGVGFTMYSYSVSGVGISDNNVSNAAADDDHDDAGFGMSYSGISVGVSMPLDEIWFRQATYEHLYGYLYQGGPAVVADDSTNAFLAGLSTDTLMSGGSSIPWVYNFKGRSLEYVGMPSGDLHPGYDFYSVLSDGVNGVFRPVARSYHTLYMSLRAEEDTINPTPYSYVLQADSGASGVPNPQYEDEYEHQDSNYTSVLYAYRYQLDGSHPNRTVYNGGNAPANPKEAVRAGISPYGYFKTKYLNEANRLIYLATPGDGDQVRSRMEFQFLEGNGYSESEPLDSIQDDENFIYGQRFQRKVNGWNYRLKGSKRIDPILTDNLPYGRLEGFRITVEDGSRYLFKQPVHSYLKTDYTINRERGAPLFVDMDKSANDYFLRNLKEILPIVGRFLIDPTRPYYYVYHSFDGTKLDDKCSESNESQVEDYFFSYFVDMNPYATQWLLTEVQGADFVHLGDSIGQNLGHQVVLQYTEPIMYRWRSPFAKPNGNPMQAQNYKLSRQAETPEGCSSEKYTASFGVKELVYLKSIETETHRAEFVLNDSNERVDGKGWESSEDSTTGRIPIYSVASLKLRPKAVGAEQKEDVTMFFSRTHVWKQSINYALQEIYLNTPLANELASRLVGQKIQLTGLEKVSQNKRFDEAGGIGFNVSTLSGGILNAKIQSYEKTKGKETQWGGYKLVVEPGADVPGLFRYAKTSKCNEDPLYREYFYCDVFGRDTSFPVGFFVDTTIWLGMNATENLANDSTAVLFTSQTRPLLDWTTLFHLREDDNQMRALERIDYCLKDSNGACRDYYKSITFDYDYSLQPKTLNSYCKGKYPDTIPEFQNEPDSLVYGICEAGEMPDQLYGKLSLRSVTESACRYGHCASLPPYHFSYNSPSSSTLKLGSVSAYSARANLAMAWYVDSTGGTVSDTNLAGLTDIDASIMNTNDQVDEWGLWNWKAHAENHKVNQDIADYAGSAWSLQKIVDPSGGVTEIEYERDTYQGESFESESHYATVVNFNTCENVFANGRDSGKVCLIMVPMYWKEECLAGRSEYWAPGSMNGQHYEYLDSLGIAVGKQVFFNLSSVLKTSVECGPFKMGSCSRSRSVASFGEGWVTGMQYLDRARAQSFLPDSIFDLPEFQHVDANRSALVLVLNRPWIELETSFRRNADRVTTGEASSWSLSNSKRFGTLMTPEVSDTLKGGNLRVTRLSYYDMGKKYSTEYQYDFPEYDENDSLIGYRSGEMPQLPDSAFTGILATRTMPTKYNWGLPNLDVPSRSRIVGVGDEDLYYLGESSIGYPRVQVRHVGNDDESDGYTDFKYVTAETGVPLDYVAPALHQFKKFVRLNLSLWIINNVWEEWEDAETPRKITVRAVDSSGHVQARRCLLSEDDPTSLFFYEDTTAGFDPSQLRKLIFMHDPFTDAETLWVDSVPFTDYNELWTTVKMKIPAKDNGSFPYDERLESVEMIRSRSQASGHMPVLYKEVIYADQSVLYKVRKDGRSRASACTSLVDFEAKVRYHDLKGFVGKTVSTTYYREKGAYEIPIRQDSVVYSVQVPSVRPEALADNEWNRSHLGRFQESWGYTKSLDCKNQNDEECRETYRRLAAVQGLRYSKDLDLVVYPVFVKEVIAHTGFNNQSSGPDEQKWVTQRTTNHWFDPVTGAPTLTVAHSDLGNGQEMRKTTVMTPHWYAAGQNPDSSIATEMFLRNMLAQNYKEEVYTWDTVAATATATQLPRSHLRNVQLSPFNYASTLWPDSVNQRVQGQPVPILSLGSFTSRQDPATLTGNLDAYRFVPPPLDSFDGNHVLQINEYGRVLEQEDGLGRRLSVFFSEDGMFQIGVFYPTKRTTLGTWVSTQENGDDFAGRSWQVPLSNLSGAQVVEFQAYAAQPLNVVVSLPGDNQTISLSKGLKAYRVVLHPSGDGTLSVNFQGVVNLRYARTYPVGAQAKTYRYDRYGFMIQTVDERNVSTYFEYDAFGSLQQIRNDDGVTFKSHSQEMMNQGGN